MRADWFRDLTNEKKLRPGKAVPLPPRRKEQFDPAGDSPDPGLADALRVALILRRPLLLTGEPGTGKTDCARYLAWKLRYGVEPNYEPLVFEAKSTSEATDLFYTYDTLARFQAKQTGEERIDPLDYIHYNALGEAILQAYPANAPEIRGLRSQRRLAAPRTASIGSADRRNRQSPARFPKRSAQRNRPLLLQNSRTEQPQDRCAGGQIAVPHRHQQF